MDKGLSSLPQLQASLSIVTPQSFSFLRCHPLQKLGSTSGKGGASRGVHASWLLGIPAQDPRAGVPHPAMLVMAFQKGAVKCHTQVFPQIKTSYLTRISVPFLIRDLILRREAEVTRHRASCGARNKKCAHSWGRAVARRGR